MQGQRFLGSFNPLTPATAAATGGGGTFSTFLGGDRPPRRRPLTVAVSVLLHAGVLGGALLWGAWRVEEIQPRREIPVVLWHSPAPPPPGPAQTDRPAGRRRPPPRDPRRVVLPVERSPTEARPSAVGSRETSEHPDDGGGDKGQPGTGECPPGRICNGSAPPPALPPQIAEKACLSCPPPRLPEAYRRAGLSLQALVKICVDAQGRVKSVNVLRGISPTVDAEMVATIERWRYTPHAINGNAVPFCYATRFLFEIVR